HGRGSRPPGPGTPPRARTGRDPEDPGLATAATVRSESAHAPDRATARPRARRPRGRSRGTAPWPGRTARASPGQDRGKCGSAYSRSMAPGAVALDNPIQDYAWGSKTAIAAFLGRENPSGRPEAELWIGAHPKAPSRVPAGPSLAELIRGAPRAMLGAGLEKQYGAELPFLLKMIAAAEPLSIQCHPNAEQARAGFERENGLGLALDAFE